MKARVQVGPLPALLVLLVLLVLLGVPLQAADAGLARGVRQVEAGDFEGAVETLAATVRRLSEVGASEDLTLAHLNLGIAYLGLDQEKAAKAHFREALKLDPALRLSSDRYPLKVTRTFAAVALENAASASPDSPRPAARYSVRLEPLFGAAVDLGWLREANALGMFPTEQPKYVQGFMSSYSQAFSPAPPITRPALGDGEPTMTALLALAGQTTALEVDTALAGYHLARAHIAVQYARCEPCVRENLVSGAQSLERVAAARPALREIAQRLREAARELERPRAAGQSYAYEWDLLYQALTQVPPLLR